MRARTRFLFADTGSAGSPVSETRPEKMSFRDVLREQLINSAIVAGIAALATWSGTTPDLIVMTKLFGITFLFEMRKYRKIT